MTLSKFQKPAVAGKKVVLEERICGTYQKPYEMISNWFPGVCVVYCVPAGECEGKAQTGQLNYLGITGEGNCKAKGYTESAALGNLTQGTSKWLWYLQGSCK